MSFGVLDGDGQVAQIEGHPFGRISFTGARYAQADVRLLSPILPSKVVCVGKNYAAHIAEMNTGDAPKEPLLFLKPSTSVIGPGDAIRIPPGSTNVHHEAELAVVIGARGARHVTPEQAAASIFGYTIGNDVTERDMQKSDGQWTRAKGFDSFCPIGPWIETDLGGARPGPGRPRGHLHRRRRAAPAGPHQPADLRRPDADLLHLAGDDAAARRRRPHRHAVRRRADPPGQRVDVTIEGLGTLSNTVAAAEAVSTAGGAR